MPSQEFPIPLDCHNCQCNTPGAKAEGGSDVAPVHPLWDNDSSQYSVPPAFCTLRNGSPGVREWTKMGSLKVLRREPLLPQHLTLTPVDRQALQFTAPRQGITVRPRIVRMRAGVKHSTAWYESPGRCCCCTASSAVGSVHVLLRVRAVRACEPGGARRRGIDICGEIRCWPADCLRGHAPITGPCELRRYAERVRKYESHLYGYTE